jgi:YggT family protein
MRDRATSGLARRHASDYTSPAQPPARRCAMLELLQFVNYLLNLYIYVLLASVIYSWLVAFNVINPYNQFVRSLGQLLDAVTEPLLRPIRRMMPDLGGLDISPMILILIIFFIQTVVIPNIAKLVV